jgi:ribonuclease HI
MEEYKLLHERNSLLQQVVDRPHSNRWTALPEGWWKANWDVAIDKISGRIGVGVVVRDDQGQMVIARSLTRMGRLDPTTSEALASYFAARLCKENGGTSLILEGDAKLVVDALNSNNCNWSRFGHIVNDTRRILHTFS